MPDYFAMRSDEKAILYETKPTTDKPLFAVMLRTIGSSPGPMHPACENTVVVFAQYNRDTDLFYWTLISYPTKVSLKEWFADKLERDKWYYLIFDKRNDGQLWEINKSI